MTTIRWTDRTWNLIVGCSLKSAGCTNCYAARMSVTGHPTADWIARQLTNARLYARAEVTMVESRADGVTIGTNHGPTVSAWHAIFATGYEMLKGIPTKGHRNVNLGAGNTPTTGSNVGRQGADFRSVVAVPLQRVGPRGRIICGGEDESGIDDEARDALTPTKIDQIEAKLGRLLPGIDPRADYAWSGSFGASPTGSPSIGAVPRMKNCYAVLGYGGNGIFLDDGCAASVYAPRRRERSRRRSILLSPKLLTLLRHYSRNWRA